MQISGFLPRNNFEQTSTAEPVAEQGSKGKAEGIEDPQLILRSAKTRHPVEGGECFMGGRVFCS